MNHDPASDNDDIAQEIELARAMGKLQTRSRIVANRKRIDIARRRRTQIRAGHQLWLLRTMPPDPAAIAIQRDLIQIIENAAPGWPYGPQILAALREGLTVRQIATRIGKQKSRTGDLVKDFIDRAKHVTLGQSCGSQGQPITARNVRRLLPRNLGTATGQPIEETEIPLGVQWAMRSRRPTTWAVASLVNVWIFKCRMI